MKPEAVTAEGDRVFKAPRAPSEQVIEALS